MVIYICIVNNQKHNSMKAIISNPPKNSAFYKHIGQTFEVIDLSNNFLTLNIQGQKKHLWFNEVFIVDFDKEIQQAYNDNNWYGKAYPYNGLVQYANSKDIQFNPEFVTFS